MIPLPKGSGERRRKMIFIINGMKYDTEKMELITDVMKWYSFNNTFVNNFFGKEVGKVYKCHLWKSKNGNWLLTHERDYGEKEGEAIEEEEAKNLLLKHEPSKYEELFEEIPEA